MKRFIQRKARSAGFVVAKTVAIHSELEAIHVGQFLDHFGVGLVLDIGANAGLYADMLRQRIGYAGRIVSCEPNPDLVARLKAASARDPAWLIEPCAVGAKAGTALLNITRHDCFSSLSTPIADETALFAAETTIERQLSVPVVTIDDLIRKHGAEAGGRVFVKIDTQGYERAIISGATASLPSIAGIQMELAFKRIYEDSWRFEDAVAGMKAIGFELSALYPNTPPPFPQLIEMDGIFHNTAMR